MPASAESHRFCRPPLTLHFALKSSSNIQILISKMDGFSSAAAVLQVLGNATSAALRAARFVNNVRNAEEFQSDFFQGLTLSRNTIELLEKQLKTETVGQSYDEDIREINRVVHEIADDCNKCNHTLARLYSNPSNNIIRRLSGELRREIRRPEIESITARFRSNVGNIQALLSVLQLCASHFFFFFIDIAQMTSLTLKF